MPVSARPVVITNIGAPVTPVRKLAEPVTIVASGDFAVVEDGQSAQIAVTGSYTNTVTFTVVAGQITEIALS